MKWEIVYYDDGVQESILAFPPGLQARYAHLTKYLTHKAFVQKMLKQPAVKTEYDALGEEFALEEFALEEFALEEFALLDELLKARRRAGLTQAEVAARMGAKTPAVAQLEAGSGSRGLSPSVAALRNYARAVGCTLDIRLRPCERSEPEMESGTMADRD